MKEEVI